MINGKGRYLGGPSVPLAVVNVIQGKRSVPGLALERKTSHRCYNSYRFRLVSISCDPSFLFSIDSHTMTVIEVEGTNVQPLPIDAVEIFAGACSSNPIIRSINQPETGQRYSVVVRCSFPFSQDCVPYVFIGHCEPARVELLYMFCLILVDLY